MNESKRTPSADSVKEGFDIILAKLTVLQSGYGLKRKQRDDMAQELMDIVIEIKRVFLSQWHTVEAYNGIIEKLEYYLEIFGHDVEDIRQKISEDKDIKEHLLLSIEDPDVTET